MVSTTPVIQWNNIYGNSVTGGDILGMANTASTLTLTTSSAGGYHYTSVWNVPVGGKILGANLSYSESDSSSNYMSGGIASYSNTVLYSTSTAQSNHWVDLTSLQPTSIRGYVYDAVWGGSKTITISQVQYIVPQPSRDRNGGISTQYNVECTVQLLGRVPQRPGRRKFGDTIFGKPTRFRRCAVRREF